MELDLKEVPSLLYQRDTVLFLFISYAEGFRSYVWLIISFLLFHHCRPYTPLKGAMSTVWFDRYKISNDCPEHIESIDSMCRGLTDVINDEIKNGIAKNRILIGKRDLLMYLF